MRPRSSRAAPRAALCASALLLALVAAGCGSRPAPTYAPPLDGVETGPPVYDGSLEPAEAVMALVPDSATQLFVTDYDQLRDQLEMPDLGSDSAASARARFDRAVSTDSAALGSGLLEADQETLADEYGFTQDDVAWQATFGDGAATDDGAQGFVVRMRDDTSFAAVQRAVGDGVGILDGATAYPSTRVVARDIVTDPTTSWAADPDLVALVGPIATATYVDRECLSSEVAYGPTARDRAAAQVASSAGGLDELVAFSVSLGAELVTVELGEGRADAFDRARLAEASSTTSRDFLEVFTRPVADPQGGRIGYTMTDPVRAAALVEQQQLPFAICTS